MAYELAKDGAASNGRVFFDTTPLRKNGPGAPDGLKVDREGNVFTTGPGGVLVLTPKGEYLGTIVTGVPTANCGFGEDGGTLYLTANDMLLPGPDDHPGVGVLRDDEASQGPLTGEALSCKLGRLF